MVRVECDITEHENGRMHLNIQVLEGSGSANPTKRELYTVVEVSKALHIALITCDKFKDVVDKMAVPQEGK